MNLVKQLRKNFVEKIRNTVSLFRNNYYHETREEIRKSIQNIISVRHKIGVLRNMWYKKT